MFRRVFWFLIGVGFALFVISRVRSWLRRARPEVLGTKVASGLGERAADFTSRVRTAMAEREAEIRTELYERGPAPG